MYFPDDMNFQYFFFDTYPGFFLQALPVALLAGVIFVVWHRRRMPEIPTGRVILSALFICYLAGLLCMTLFHYVLGDIYYFLFYHRPSGGGFYWFNFTYDFIPDFFHHFGSENLGNILMFLPFGVLYPLFDGRATWGQTMWRGIGLSVAIELLQPIFGRSFDVNDIILNGLGAILSATGYFILKTALQRRGKVS